MKDSCLTRIGSGGINDDGDGLVVNEEVTLVTALP